VYFNFSFTVYLLLHDDDDDDDQHQHQHHRRRNVGDRPCIAYVGLLYRTKWTCAIMMSEIMLLATASV